MELCLHWLLMAIGAQDLKSSGSDVSSKMLSKESE